ncbi:hypothetical protein KQX54_000232 [Cotesia glomerata]|uniref:Uncharacterized protein n=1 Tax=Cotesia glomerata TaxID=32391 RepID=A0AAV7I8B3_COTGL|nr:hypothetical protein KQX54_000232 [Cotesia glomerata]
MSNILQYQAIFPIEWLRATDEEIDEFISSELELRKRSSEDFKDTIITFKNIVTILQVSDLNMSWWFRIPGEKTPSPWVHHFTGNSLVEMYPDLEAPWRHELNSMIEEGKDLPDLQILQRQCQQSSQQEMGFIKNYLIYEAIIPKVWLDIFGYQYVVKAVLDQVNELSRVINNINNLPEGQDGDFVTIQRLNQPLITIGTNSAYLIINDENHYWWLRLQTDVTRVPTLENYKFTGNLIYDLLISGMHQIQRQQQLLRVVQQQQQQPDDQEIIILEEETVNNSDGDYESSSSD